MKAIDINNSENTNATLIYAAQKNIDIVTAVSYTHLTLPTIRLV